MYACANSWVYGGTVQRSGDLGQTWERSEGLGLPEESELKLASTWHLEPGHASEPDTLWLGGEPAVLFRSDDSGATWQVNDGVLAHPTRDKWSPGAGGLITHSIALDADDPKQLWIGISAAGVFRTDDAGATWAPANVGTEACFSPEDPYPEVGQCVHKVLSHPGRPGRLWQQNHCGVYRSDDHGASWERLDGNGLPSGFVADLVLDERGEVRSLVHVYVDGERAHDLAAPVGEKSRIRIVAAIAGGDGPPPKEPILRSSGERPRSSG
jgi:photosystem II stability/assembly factor-like uncharacterized protein